MKTPSLRQGGPVKLGDTVYQLPEARYHGRRDDGVYVPIYIDSRADADVQRNVMSAINNEARVLRAAGATVL